MYIFIYNKDMYIFIYKLERGEKTHPHPTLRM